ncbi:MAG TPA: FAD-binding oxidoreductase [Sphingorhabdus sp.]|nr:FAD-binding oxidoreductase [Sphingorhabdus sp.]
MNNIQEQLRPDLEDRADTDRLHKALFNGALKPEARSFTVCNDEPAVQRAVRAAAVNGTPVAVVGGGHDMWGRGFIADNAILDIGAMATVEVDEEGGTIAMGGGALAADLITALPPDRAVVTGTILGVGMTGLTLAGGYGVLNSRFGLAADNLLAARVVLADGSVVVASERENTDLLWALRGGGSGFGVVTQMTVAMHHLPRLLTGMVFVPLDHAPAALHVAQQLIDEHPTDIGLFMGLMMGPEGAPVLFLAPHWTGEEQAGETLLHHLASLRGAIAVGHRWTTYRESFDPESEKAFPKGAHYHLLTRTLRRLDHLAIQRLVEGARRMEGTDAIILHDFHGAAARVGSDATAFALRDEHFVVEVIANWPATSSHGPSRKAWAERLDTELATIAMPGGYAGLLAPSASASVADFYGTNAERLLEIKRRFDPQDLFRSGIGRLVG